MNFQDLLTQQIETGFETTVTPCPVGTWDARVGKITEKSFASGEIKKGQRQGEPWFSVSIPLEITHPDVTEVTGFNPTVVYLSIMLDITPSGQLSREKGKNIKLGQFLAACGLDKSGSFSFQELTGYEVQANVEHELYKDRLQARVSGVIAP
jgi:hypothetical protein